MPTLPSGRILALAKHHILPPGTVGFKCPEGHFWFHQLDRKICPPPLKPGEDFLCDFVHAPCPTTREEIDAAEEAQIGRKFRCLAGSGWAPTT